MSEQRAWPPIPKTICNKTKVNYGKPVINYDLGKFLGKGGFARVHEAYERKASAGSHSSSTRRGAAGQRSHSNDFPLVAKLVAKTAIVKPHQKEKMSQEIRIHKCLKHENIAQFHENFTTTEFVVIIMELCPNKSLMELSKRRSTILEAEARFYMKHLFSGIAYLHENEVAHRDLKLSNIFLGRNMECKIGDFGLAVKVEPNGNRRTVCGTPNYLAPEILTKVGHAHKVDIWSAGVIVFTLLSGKPAFETNSLRETYARIKACNYDMPRKISSEAKVVISKMLTGDPARRPQIVDVQEYPWFDLWTPRYLPLSALTTEPRLDEEGDEENIPPPTASGQAHAGVANIPSSDNAQKPVRRSTRQQAGAHTSSSSNNNNNNNHSHKTSNSEYKKLLQQAIQSNPKYINNEQAKNPEDIQGPSHGGNGRSSRARNAIPERRRLSIIRYGRENEKNCMRNHLTTLLEETKKLLNSSSKWAKNIAKIDMDEAEHPEISPIYWIAKWVDFQDKYGFGYALSQGHKGINFNDEERIILNANNENLTHIGKNLTEYHYNKSQSDWDPSDRNLKKKIALTDHIVRYMERLINAGKAEKNPCDEFARIPYLKKWMRIDQDLNLGGRRPVWVANERQPSNQPTTDTSCVVFILTNGTFQCNFLKSHIKIVICPLLKAITFFSYGNYSNRTYSIDGLVDYGCDSEALTYVNYAYLAAKQLLVDSERGN